MAAKKDASINYLKSLDIFFNQEFNTISQILNKIEPYDLEFLVAELFLDLGFEDVEVTPPKNDGGIDVKCKKSIFEDFYANCIIQVKQKRDGSNLDVKPIRELFGILKNGEYGFVVTTGGFSDGASQFAETQCNNQIKLINGKHLTELLMENYNCFDKYNENEKTKIKIEVNKLNLMMLSLAIVSRTMAMDDDDIT